MSGGDQYACRLFQLGSEARAGVTRKTGQDDRIHAIEPKTLVADARQVALQHRDVDLGTKQRSQAAGQSRLVA